MSRASVPVLLAVIGLAACNPHAADSNDGGAGEPASAPASAPATDFSGDFDLRGTEPFWSLTIRSDRLMLSRADGGDFTAPNNGPQADGDMAVWDGGPLKVTLAEKPCADGATERNYAFTATVELTDVAPLKGCANRVPEH